MVGSTLPLRVGSALRDLEFVTEADPAGFDIELLRHVAERLGREWRLVRYPGAFNGALAGPDVNA